MTVCQSSRQKARRCVNRRQSNWLIFHRDRRKAERRLAQRRCGYDTRPRSSDAYGPTPYFSYVRFKQVDACTLVMHYHIGSESFRRVLKRRGNRIEQQYMVGSKSVFELAGEIGALSGKLMIRDGETMEGAIRRLLGI